MCFFSHFSFHVGSGCYDAGAFATAVLSARSVFDFAVSIIFLNVYFIVK
jgi:diaminopimelate decarboxylase